MELRRTAMRLFLSYRFADERFVQKVNYYLSKQQALEPYCFADEKHTEVWVKEVSARLTEADAFILFVGSEIGQTQKDEAVAAFQLAKERQLEFLLVMLPGGTLTEDLAILRAVQNLKVSEDGEGGANKCAKEITQALAGNWQSDDDLPIGYPFSYEKDIIKAYSEGGLSGTHVAQGCPEQWPRIVKNKRAIENPVPENEIGLYRDWDYDWDGGKGREKEQDPEVVPAALTEYRIDRLLKQRITIPEAGPRKFLHYPTHRDSQLIIGILVSGGIAPGINSVIAGIVERHFLYARFGGYKRALKVLGCHNGLGALFYPGNAFRPLTLNDVDNRSNQGGSMLGTSRVLEFMSSDPSQRRSVLEDAVQRLTASGIEILYVIGGDGSMRAAHALWYTARSMGRRLSIIGIPKTMDNDILWVWQSFGFLSAVERSKEAILQLHTETNSNPRLCIIQLFGSDSGFVVTHAVSASGVCDLFLIPEVPFRMDKVSDHITYKLRQRYIERGLESSYGMIVMAETAIPEDARNYFNDPEVRLNDEEKKEIDLYLKNKRVYGQTPDSLRSGGLKLLSRVLQKAIRDMGGDYWERFRVFTNEPRHLIRAIPPSSSDVIYARRLGSLAVDGAMAGYSDFMISQWLTEYVMVPLKLVTLGRKRVPKDGIFYKAARASTGQPASLIE
jgi:6-phosphofructokinase 1